jgi:hypothetical protein
VVAATDGAVPHPDDSDADVLPATDQLNDHQTTMIFGQAVQKEFTTL